VARGISRRAFVSGGAIAVTLGAVPALRFLHVLGGGSSLGSRRSGLAAQGAAAGSQWLRSRFTPFAGETFRMTDGHANVDVVLTDVMDLDPVLRSNDEKRFVLVFAAAHSHPLADGIRKFRHPGFGEVDMFVSPVGRRIDPIRYQVIVNRL
jgi:hypothetical protein